MGDIETTENRVSTLEREMHDVNKTLYKGNGQPPLVATVAEVRRALATQTWLLRLTLGAAVTSLVRQFLG